MPPFIFFTFFPGEKHFVTGLHLVEEGRVGGNRAEKLKEGFREAKQKIYKIKVYYFERFDGYDKLVQAVLDAGVQLRGRPPCKD